MSEDKMLLPMEKLADSRDLAYKGRVAIVMA